MHAARHSRFKGKVLKWTFLLCALFLLSTAWIYNQGSQGPIIFCYFPGLIHEYPSDHVRKIDIFITLSLSMLFTNLIVIRMKNAYRYERSEVLNQTKLKEALNESEKKFRAFFNSSNDAVFVHPFPSG